MENGASLTSQILAVLDCPLLRLFFRRPGYDDNLPSRFASAPRCTKPYHIEALVQQLAALVAAPQVSAGIA